MISRLSNSTLRLRTRNSVFAPYSRVAEELECRHDAAAPLGALSFAQTASADANIHFQGSPS
jgi:hypothetical protein